MDKYIGRLLDNRYEILEVLGTGGMAVVYKARCHRLNRLVAIKILKDDYLQDEEFRRRFHSESQAVAMLSHPNIVSVYDVSTSIMADYIVMELIEGITLKQYMEKKGVLNWKETLHFAIQIAKALEHAHSRGIVHRDIKPHNVMVLKNGSVKVTDFGIARMMSKGNTLTKEALGSVHYISPEQAKGGRVDSRSDIYSLGVVMYEMMAGRPPYDGDSPVSVAIQHINGGAAMPSTLNPNIPGGLEQIIMKAMAHEIHDRYVSATRMLSDMDEFRKDPSLLFDYNTPPIDEVTRLQKAPITMPAERTTADRVAAKSLPPRKSAEELKAQRAERETRRKQQQKEESRGRMATIAIITCSVVAVVAVVIFLFVLLGNGNIGQNDNLVEVPYLVGKQFAELEEYPDLIIIREETYDDVIPEGEIIKQNPSAEDQVIKGTTVVVTVSLGSMPKIVYMPDVVEMTKERAISILDSQSMNLQYVEKEEYHEDIPEGSVIRTDPVKDTELTTGQTITLYISKGIEIKTGKMPNLIDLTKELAESTLDRQHLELDVSTEEVFDSNIAEGCVVRTEPEMNEDLKTGMSVKLYISKGPEKKLMPNVEGMDIEKAVNILMSAGFKMPVIEPVESNEDKDVVVKQSHEKNTEIDVNTQITLEISQGPAETTIPTVTKDVTINLRDSTAEAPCMVKVQRDGVTVFEQTVEMGVNTITIPGQTGSGMVYYTVVINEQEGWHEQVAF